MFLWLVFSLLSVSYLGFKIALVTEMGCMRCK